MRNFTVGLLGGLVALVGFAGSASALATIDLIWVDTGTSTYVDPPTTTNIVLNVVLNSGTGPSSRGGGITVDYSAAGELTFVSATNSTDPLFTLGSPAGPPSDNGSDQVINLNAVSFLPLPDFTTIVLATITFSVTAGGAGTFDLITLYTGLDAIDQMDLAGGFGTASITRTPEPGTLSLVAMGLGGLYVVGRRRKR